MARRIRVTSHYINDGNVFHCPIEWAIIEATGKQDVSVGHEIIRVEGRIYDAPESVTSFVNSYDEDGAHVVSPFSFELPKHYMRVKDASR